MLPRDTLQVRSGLAIALLTGFTVWGGKVDAQAADSVASLSSVHATSAVDCSTAPAVEPRVTLSYPALPSESSVANVPTPDIVLVVTNTSSRTLNFELVGRMHAKGERRELSLASGTLLPFVSQTLTLPLGGMGIGIANFAFSGHLSIEARIKDPSGRFLDRAFAPELYFHPLAGTSVSIYRDGARRAYFRAGDLRGSVFPGTVPAKVLGVFDGGAGVGSLREDTGPAQIAGRSLPPNFTGPALWQFCMRWVYESVDSGFGEDHYVSGTLMKARGMRVRVDHPNWAMPQEFIASDDNGCFSFHAAENTGFVVTMFAQAHLGAASNMVFKGFESEDAAFAAPNDPPQWMLMANPGGAPRRVYYQNQASEISNLMALGTFTFHWNDIYTNPRLKGPASIFLVPDNKSCSNQTGSCQPKVSGKQFLQIEPGRTNRKFLVGHEVGHWIHRLWTNDDLGLDNSTYSANSGDADCAFVGAGSHAMRSKEYSVGGFTEGFAHFLSALAWNRHDQTGGIFRYYKDITDAAYHDLKDDNWVVDLDGIGGSPLGGISKWMQNKCAVDDGHSVEMDWLRFYWDYLTNSDTKPTRYQILRHIQFMREAHPWTNNTTAYDRLKDAIQDPALGQGALEDRFIDFAGANGVAQ
jgi:hypothetical protein